MIGYFEVYDSGLDLLKCSAAFPRQITCVALFIAFNPYSPGYSYVSSANRDPDTRTRVGGPSTGIHVHE